MFENNWHILEKLNTNYFIKTMPKGLKDLNSRNTQMNFSKKWIIFWLICGLDITIVMQLELNRNDI